MRPEEVPAEQGHHHHRRCRPSRPCPPLLRRRQQQWWSRLVAKPMSVPRSRTSEEEKCACPTSATTRVSTVTTSLSRWPSLKSFPLSLVVAVMVVLAVAALPAATEANILDAVLQGRADDLVYNTLGAMGSVITNCLVGRDGWSDPELGDFYPDDRYCDQRCLRHLICCAPEKPDELGVQFLLSNRRFTNHPLTFGASEASAALDPGPVVFIVHGFLNHYNLENIWNATRIGWVDRGANAIVVDWSRGNRLYLQSMANVRVVGALVGQLIKFLDTADRTTCAGFSLGSHICGEAGSWLKGRGQTLSSCHGIDPAGPGYDGCGADIRLDPTDCGVVTSIHSSQFTDLLGFGTKYKSGHCDFWMNDALMQPLCNANPTTAAMVKGLFSFQFHRVTQGVENLVGCSHVRAMKYYISQLKGDCLFRGEQGVCGNGAECTTYRSARAMTMSPDDKCGPKADVDFKVRTTGVFPYC